MKKYFIRATKILVVLPINFTLYMLSSFFMCLFAGINDIVKCFCGELDGEPIKFYIHGNK